ncbi:MAG TPA: chloride channel protein [Anaerolineae bacterium]|nr:chloride channel protein [Anaerolineae bacterium]
MNSRHSLSASLPRWLDRAHPSESVVLGGAALVVGLTSGAGVWLFKQLIELVYQMAYGNIGAALGNIVPWLIVLIPVSGGLVVGLLLHFFVGEERHHGVAGIMEAVALAGGRLRYKRLPSKAVAAALSIGVGASVGPEDPSVQIGANLGSMFGQWLHLSDERVRTLVAAGAAGGIAAAFNAPIAGVFFALEIIVGELAGSMFGIVILAAVISAVFTQAVSGPQPAFKVPAYAFQSAQELPLYLGLGLVAGPIAALYIRALYLAQDVFHGLHVPRWLKPAIAGAIVGVTGLFLPQILGVGYSTIEQILNGAIYSIGLLLALLVAKLIMTPVSIGGGFPGGVFAPSLFLGATLGAAYGTMAQQLFPGMSLAPQAFAMVGMAAVLAGAVHAPLTAIILLFEMTNDYHIILPLMFAVAVSLWLAQHLQHDSVYVHGLARKGIRIAHGRDVDVLEALTVSEVMQPEVTPLGESDSLASAAEVFMQTRHHGLPVLNQTGELCGILTVQDIERFQNDGGVDNHTVGDAATRELLVTYADETIGAALRRMSARDVGRMPVVSRGNPRQLIGLLRRSDLVRAYDIALTRRAEMRHRAQQVRLGAFGGVSVEEAVIAANAACVNKRVSEVQWPRASVIATLRRGSRVIIPHGDTVLKPGDVLIIAAEGEAREAVRQLCSADQILSDVNTGAADHSSASP